MRIRRPIATALLCSSLLHLLAAVGAWFWFPGATPREAVGDGYALSVSLTGPGVHRDRPQAPPATVADLSAPPVPKPPPPDPTPALPADLNPAPQLREDFSIPSATLALISPIAEPQVQSLQLALNRVADKLPEWTRSGQGDAARSLQWSDGGQNYEITVGRLPPGGPMDLEHAVVTVVTEQDGMALRARLPFKRVAFSHFAQLVNRWDPKVSLAGDSIIGRFHSNSSLTVDVASGPRVTGSATVAGRVKMSGRGDRAGVFPRGLETGARRIPMPDRPFDPVAAGVDPGSMHRILDDARIHFHGDGSYEWSAKGVGQGALVVPDRYPWIIMGDGDAELSVEGEVNGSFLVYSSRRISISGNLRYMADPRDTRSDDFLGLVTCQ